MKATSTPYSTCWRGPWARAVAFCFVVGLTSFASRADAGVLRVVFAIDKKAERVGRDLEFQSLSLAFLANVPESQYKAHYVDPEDMSERAMLQAIRTTPVGPDDTLMFYYIGHGAYDATNGTYMTPSASAGGVLFATRVLQELKARSPRLAVVVFDCCNREQAPPVYAAPAPVVPGALEQPSPLFDELFFKRAGSVLVVSSSPGEYALIKAVGSNADDGVPPGPIFTNSLALTLIRNAQVRMEWSSMIKLTQAQLDVYFDAMMGPGKRLTLDTGQVVQQDKQRIQVRFFQ